MLFVSKICCMHNHVTILSALVMRHKAEVNDINPYNGWRPIHTAAFYNSIDAIWVCYTIQLTYYSFGMYMN